MTSDSPFARGSVNWSDLTVQTGRRLETDPVSSATLLRFGNIGGIDLSEWAMTPCSGIRRRSSGGSAVSLIFVQSGTLEYGDEARRVIAAAGSLHLFGESVAVRFSALTNVAVLHARVPTVYLRAKTGSELALLVQPLDSSRIQPTFVAILDSVLDPAGEDASSAAGQALRAVAVALIEESSRPARGRDIRAEMTDYIDEHIADRDLGPRKVAAAFNISLRWAHRVFDIDGVTMAQHIRDRRLDIVTADLEIARHVPPFRVIAERSGFHNRDTLARLFRQRHGMSMSEYIAAVRHD